MEWWQFFLCLMVTINTFINVIVFVKGRKIMPHPEEDKEVKYLTGKGKLSDAN